MSEFFNTESVTAMLIMTCGVALVIKFAIHFGGKDEPEVKGSHPHPSNHWSGRCYRCGNVLESEPVTLHSVGKPPKRFCPTCRPTFA